MHSIPPITTLSTVASCVPVIVRVLELANVPKTDGERSDIEPGFVKSKLQSTVLHTESIPFRST